MKLGCHLSSAGGYTKMGQTALKIGADTFQFFTRNPRGGKAKEIDEKDLQSFLQLLEQYNFLPVMAHAPYTLNPASKEPRISEFAQLVMRDDLMRLEKIPGCFYNLHPGSHTGVGVEAGIHQMSALLNEVLPEQSSTLVLLETMSGKGSEIGSSFEELRAMIDGVQKSEQLGVCLDTCHVFCAGYDIVNDLDGVLEEFDRSIGLNRLKAVHLNDSMHPLGSHKDRHACLGEGHIGIEALLRIMKHPVLSELPFYLETPQDDEGHGREIAMLKSRL